MFKPLSSWIKRNHPLPVRFYTAGYVDKPKNEWSVWLSIEEVSPLYLATNMKWQSLEESRKITQDYLNEASELINGLEGGWLDHEEQELIINYLGLPPDPSLPIYLITYTNSEDQEELAYIGITKKSSRFLGGHPAALKLHSPKYTNTVKKIYRCTAWFHDDDEYISLDWMQPESLSLELIDSLESHLIYHFQPELNTAKKKNNLAKWDFYIHIQNFLDGKFLNDKFV
ncbi:hypothetical protein [Microbulbifer variabilis]|uniref:hypothetical protein n=1 Tax=Microbulbifer variabilis TaxID=266805 RepID=UPI001CFDAF0A|nr:hypothetical protein [Microbulbifer variabilis]